MFYTLSKVLWFALQPSSLITLALVVGTLKAVRGSPGRGRKWLVGGIAALVLAGLSPLTDLLLAPLETQYARTPLGKGDITGIIVLGGVEDGRSTSPRELMALGEAGERVTEAVALARQFPTARVLFSGGSEEVLRTKQPEAVTASRLFNALGLEPARLLIEDRSRNTAENAQFSQVIAAPKSGERWLLVTSAWHMPRAMGCFNAVGFAVEPWPVDYRTPEHFEFLRFHANIGEGLRRLDFAAKEYLGLLIYRITGRAGPARKQANTPT
jgi:uncharacterized SAM-binding protein YcdF (DUF218 family)